MAGMPVNAIRSVHNGSVIDTPSPENKTQCSKDSLNLVQVVPAIASRFLLFTRMLFWVRVILYHCAFKFTPALHENYLPGFEHPSLNLKQKLKNCVLHGGFSRGYLG